MSASLSVEPSFGSASMLRFQSWESALADGTKPASTISKTNLL
jgi:hypothetical protein